MAIAIPTFAADHKRMMMEFDRYTMAGIMTRDEPTGKVSISYNGNPKLEYNLSTQTVNRYGKRNVHCCQECGLMSVQQALLHLIWMFQK